jgi:hypothetical protein
MTDPSNASAPVIIRDGADASPLLGRLMVEWTDVFREELLKNRLDPTDCSRAHAGSAARRWRRRGS